MQSSSIRSLKKVLASKLKCGFPATAHGYISQSTSHKIQVMESFNKSLTRSIVALYGPDMHQPDRIGTGVFLDPTLIVTSAHVVGHVTASYEVEKSEKSEHGRVVHKSHIGTTVALTAANAQILTTKPLAVNFGHDLAVLKVVVKPGEALFTPRSVSNSPPPNKGDLLMSISNRPDTGCVSVSADAIGEFKGLRSKAPWPMDDDLPWMAHDVMVFPGDPIPILGEKVSRSSGMVTWASGSPWFNVYGEVVGIASWEASDGDSSGFVVGYAVPPVCIRAVLDYAKTKGAEDPIVMDRWIDSTHAIP